MSLRARLIFAPWRVCRCEGGDRPLCPAGSGCAGRLDQQTRAAALARLDFEALAHPCLCQHPAGWHSAPAGACAALRCACPGYSPADPVTIAPE